MSDNILKIIKDSNMQKASDTHTQMKDAGNNEKDTTHMF